MSYQCMQLNFSQMVRWKYEEKGRTNFGIQHGALYIIGKIQPITLMLGQDDKDQNGIPICHSLM